jgi:hypothetical protein
MSGVCGLVDGYADPIPDSLVVELTRHMQSAHASLKDQLSRDPSYTIAAKCLRRLISDRKADYRRLSEAVNPIGDA